MIGILVIFVVLWLVWRIRRARRDGLRDSDALAACIKADLLAELGAKAAHVECSKRVAILSGSVPYTEFREVAGNLALRRGARHVINELQVVPSAPGRPNPYLAGLSGVKPPTCMAAARLDLSLDERAESKDEIGLSKRESLPYTSSADQAGQPLIHEGINFL